MKLYHAPFTRSVRPRLVLEELGVPYELITLDLSSGDHKKPDHLAVHPLGRVPALTDGEVTIFESLAICLYLADKYPDKGLAPAVDSPERGPYLQWMVYAISTLEPAILAIISARDTHGGDMHHEAVKAAQARFTECAAVVEEALRGREHLAGDHLTAADLLIGSTLGWAARSGLAALSPGLGKYVGSVASRPAAARALAG